MMASIFAIRAAVATFFCRVLAAEIAPAANEAITNRIVSATSSSVSVNALRRPACGPESRAAMARGAGTSNMFVFESTGKNFDCPWVTILAAAKGGCKDPFIRGVIQGVAEDFPAFPGRQLVRSPRGIGAKSLSNPKNGTERACRHPQAAGAERGSRSARRAVPPADGKARPCAAVVQQARAVAGERKGGGRRPAS